MVLDAQGIDYEKPRTKGGEVRKKKTVSKLKKELWKWFSMYIRQRDKGICFTCDKVIPDYYDRHGNPLPGWKAAQAGHWITAANCGLALYFHEKNVHCQCYHCNINLSGNWLAYERKIIQVYGMATCEELKNMKWNSDEKWKDFEYEEKIKHYKKLVNLTNQREG